MYKNELAIVSIKPNLAYGSIGRRPDIPPDCRITYLFGLLHFEKQKQISEMTWAQVRSLQILSSLVHSHWSSCYITALSLIESFIMMLRQLSYAIIDPFRAWKPPILMP